MSGVAAAPLMIGAGQQFLAGNTASESRPEAPGNPLLKGEPGTEVKAPVAPMLKPLIKLLKAAV
jgi:hypothetical protein